MGNRDKKSEKTFLIQISPLHTFKIEEEKERVTNNGGEIIHYYKPRIYRPNLYMPGLSISRSIGDGCVRDYGVICEPSTGEIELTSFMPYFVIVTNSFFECSKQADLEKILIDKLNKYDCLENVTESVVTSSKETWEEHERVIDDITVFAVVFDEVKKDEVLPFSLCPSESQVIRADTLGPRVRNRLISIPRVMQLNSTSEISEYIPPP